MAIASSSVLTSLAVGFTGSGQAMRQDVTRTRHNYTLDDQA